MLNKRTLVMVGLAVLAVLLVAAVGVGGAQAPTLTPEEQLGKSMYFDANLSINMNQSCAVCHGPEAGWTGPNETFNSAGSVYEGSIPGRFGNRKPPSSAYATQSPILHFSNQAGGLWIGGNFWDGRATGEKLGNPAADQAVGPPLNPLEMGNPDAACVIWKVCTAAGYPVSFEDVWGADSCAIAWPVDPGTTCATEGGILALSDADRAKVSQDYDYFGLSIAAFEASPEVNAFSSKWDASLKGQAKLTKAERRGMALFEGKAKCARCHVSSGQQALFADYTFDNLGVPKNPENPFYAELTFNPLGADWIDEGLGAYLKSAGYPASVYASELGTFKVPTLRNVDLRPYPDFVKAYSHNGFFKSLESIVHFYNTRDVLPTCLGEYTDAQAMAADCWPAPEFAANLNTKEVGNLGLTPQEEADLVAFLKTLSDGYIP
jgi:cytochrome c peroxidase